MHKLIAEFKKFSLITKVTIFLLSFFLLMVVDMLLSYSYFTYVKGYDLSYPASTVEGDVYNLSHVNVKNCKDDDGYYFSCLINLVTWAGHYESPSINNNFMDLIPTT
jgi:hypothetical protein